VTMIIVVVRGRRMWRIQLRVGMIVGIHTGDGARGQLAGSSLQILFWFDKVQGHREQEDAAGTV